jgi:hypothetical protein
MLGAGCKTEADAVWKTLKAYPLPRGWLPAGPDDQILVEIFTKAGFTGVWSSDDAERGSKPTLLQELRRAKVDWQATKESPYIFQVSFGGKTIRLRLNQIPYEPMWTVIIDDKETNIDEFPTSWTLSESGGQR